MRKACHNILYTVANASIVSNEVSATWVVWVVVCDCVIAALLVLWIILTVRKYRRKDK